MRMLAVALLASLLAVAPASAAPSKDIVDTAVGAGSFETLVAAVKQAGLVEALKGEGPLTVFAPTDEAFAKLPEGTVAQLLRPENKDKLTAVLTYHVVKGAVRSTDLLKVSSAPTLNGASVSFGLRVRNANVVKADIECSNGIIHVIDRVLLPPAPMAKQMPPARSAQHIILEAIDRGVPIYNHGNHQGCADIYSNAARQVLSLSHKELGPMDRKDIQRALNMRSHSASDRAWNLRHAFDRMLDNANFKPMIEAAMPPGFPAPGPVGRVVMKRYPGYRAARAEGGNTFWTLFRHIKSNNVEMTAPVEMTMDGNMRPKDMAFLYEGPDQGRTGRQGDVDVLDLEPVMVLSIGMRGHRSSSSLADAKAAIADVLKVDGWEATGDYRVLGYNSPMVPANRRFWELQLPVRRAP